MNRRRRSSTTVDLTALDEIPVGVPVLIRWHDAHTVTGWWTPADRLGAEPCAIVSCGLFVKITDHELFYAGDAAQNDPDHHMNAISAVPLGCIVEVHRLEAAQ